MFQKHTMPHYKTKSVINIKNTQEVKASSRGGPISVLQPSIQHEFKSEIPTDNPFDDMTDDFEWNEPKNNNLKIEQPIVNYKTKLEQLKQKIKMNMDEELYLDQLDLECSCCYSVKPIDDFCNCKSNHKTCIECIKIHAQNMIIENGNFNIKCITTTTVCNSLYDDKLLEKILTKKIFDQYLRLKIKKETEYIFSMGDINLIKCQFCEAYWDIEKDEKILNCRECNKNTCLECKQLEHKGRPCDKIRIQIEEGLTNEKFLICNKCSTCIEKVEGCKAVQCRCGNNMCWDCKKNWGETDAHGCTCSVKINVANQFNGNATAQQYINKLR